MSSPTPTPQPRGFPAPCWIHDESVALIVSYREKWDSLGRRNLRSTDWDEVAASVCHQSAAASGSTPKSSAQCRHKIEKLRRRFRAERQRCANFKGKVFSSWDLFDLMASIEPTASEPVVSKSHGKKNSRYAEFDQSHDFDPDLRGHELRGGLGSKRSFKAYEEEDDDQAIDAVNHRANVMYNRVSRDFTHSPDEEEEDDVIGFPVKSLGNRNLVSPELHPRKYSRIASVLDDPYPDYDEYQENSRFRHVKNNRAYLPGKSRGVREIMDASTADKVSSSIRVLVDNLLQVEKMKMEMVKDLEKMRMRMEVKRSEMIIKSEQMIVNTLIEAVYDDKKNSSKKKKVSPE